MNGDDDMGGTIGEGTDYGGGMFTSPGPPPEGDDDDEVVKRRISRRTERPKFRSKRKARRTPR